MVARPRGRPVIVRTACCASRADFGSSRVLRRSDLSRGHAWRRPRTREAACAPASACLLVSYRPLARILACRECSVRAHRTQWLGGRSHRHLTSRQPLWRVRGPHSLHAKSSKAPQHQKRIRRRHTTSKRKRRRTANHKKPQRDDGVGSSSSSSSSEDSAARRAQEKRRRQEGKKTVPPQGGEEGQQAARGPTNHQGGGHHRPYVQKDAHDAREAAELRKAGRAGHRRRNDSSDDEGLLRRGEARPCPKEQQTQQQSADYGKAITTGRGRGHRRLRPEKHARA